MSDEPMSLYALNAAFFGDDAGDSENTAEAAYTEDEIAAIVARRTGQDIEEARLQVRELVRVGFLRCVE